MIAGGASAFLVLDRQDAADDDNQLSLVIDFLADLGQLDRIAVCGQCVLELAEKHGLGRDRFAALDGSELWFLALAILERVYIKRYDFLFAFAFQLLVKTLARFIAEPAALDHLFD